MGRASSYIAVWAAAAICSAVSIAPATADVLVPADLYSIQTTFTATPNVVQVGETVLLDLTVRLIPDFGADAAAGVIVFGTAGGVFDTLSISDGAGHTRSFSLMLTANLSSEYTFTTSYSAPGNYVPTFQGTGQISVERLPVGTEFIHHFGATINGLTSVSVIPGPMVGAGLPGLLLAVAGLFGYRRRLTRSVSIGS